MYSKIQNRRKWIYCAIVALFFTASSVSARPHTVLKIDSPSYDGGAGLFHNFCIVLGGIYLYEKSKRKDGVVVDFGQGGLFYEKSAGDNWWEYYFEKISYFGFKDKKGVYYRQLSDREKAELGNFVHFYMPRKKVHDLISRYVRLKKTLKDEIHCFYEKFMKGKTVIGVHYRGTDKWCEAEYISEEDVIKKIKTYQEKKGLLDATILVATDEQSFLDKMRRSFGNEKIIHSGATLSSSGVALHHSEHSPYKIGKEAIIDCYLLSLCHHLFRTTSHLSSVSLYLNPRLQVVNLNKLDANLIKGITKNGRKLSSVHF